MWRGVNKRLCSTVALTTMLVTTFFCLYLWLRFLKAVEVVNDLRLEVSRVTGAAFYASPKQITTRRRITRSEIVAHLKAINFTENGGPQQPGSFRLEGGDRLVIFPRLPEFGAVRIGFDGGAVAFIHELRLQGGRSIETPVDQTLLEPELLGGFRASADRAGNAQLFVRCYPAQWPELEASHLLYAVLAREDPGFMAHRGISYRSLARAAASRLRGDDSGGGSTITMQLVKNVVTRDWEPTLSRKIDELFYAAALESRLAKADLFTLYANSVYLGARDGSSLYGFSAAAEEYFGRIDLRRLTLNEACVLAALINRPNHYLNLADKGDIQPIRDRRDRVLDALRHHWPEEYPLPLIEATKKESVRFAAPPTHHVSSLDNISEEFVMNYAAKREPLLQLKKSLTPAEYARLRIYTTLDADLMREAERIVSIWVPTFEHRYPALNDCGPADSQQRANDRKHANKMLASIIALDPRNGAVVTMYGGAGGKAGYLFARAAINAFTRPASLVKPFWQAQAFDMGGKLPKGDPVTPASIVDAAAYSVDGWRPAQGVGVPDRLRRMMAYSRDDYAAFLVSRTGLRNAVDLYERLSHRSISAPAGEASIGLQPGMETTPLAVARAYSIFAHEGSAIEPTPFSQVFLDGRPIDLVERPSEYFFRAESAYLTTQMMRSVVGFGVDGAYGTLRKAFQSSGLRVDQLEIAGKTGSGPDAVWAVSISPRLIVVVWLGYQCPPQSAGREAHARKLFQQRMKSFLAGHTAAYPLTDFLKSVAKHRPDMLAGRFERPPSIVEYRIHPQTGCRWEGNGGVTEYFVSSNSPRLCRESPQTTHREEGRTIAAIGKKRVKWIKKWRQRL